MFDGIIGKYFLRSPFRRWNLYLLDLTDLGHDDGWGEEVGERTVGRCSVYHRGEESCEWDASQTCGNFRTGEGSSTSASCGRPTGLIHRNSTSITLKKPTKEFSPKSKTMSLSTMSNTSRTSERFTLFRRQTPAVLSEFDQCSMCRSLPQSCEASQSPRILRPSAIVGGSVANRTRC
ncbi:uncharacterized protein LOC117147165 [Drosophila mauritiana]|uniref:Uncharacterized protein LOC117147165 n=1 Tax=Drosophila mauritiana TaxID=7226 RepID=A0A6P8KLB8_DROMA|nr:uncharacterized protein LOC117147165 [Drosophila mauritiana]